ncbi:hypothetical protein [Sorangium atrum]|uniref:Uncharacterized protein n=1 Tax=Sorangium atrum TaxID=2995308 RepID=A0ABT5BSE3_9BACT|nr:hypothetical protein [Sorangium aterium]MDC0677022.1 hypothetical protein [Sorangium aterium]
MNRPIGHVVTVQRVATLLHRALAVITDEPVERALATNLLLFAAVHATSGPSLPRVSRLSVALCAAGAAATTIFPEHPAAIYVTGSLTAAIVVRHLDQRAVACPVVAREREVLRESKGSPSPRSLRASGDRCAPRAIPVMTIPKDIGGARREMAPTPPIDAFS